MDKTIVIVPDWIRESAKQTGMSLTDTLSVKKLLSTVSGPDVAFYIYINSPSAVDHLLGRGFVPLSSSSPVVGVNGTDIDGFSASFLKEGPVNNEYYRWSELQHTNATLFNREVEACLGITIPDRGDFGLQVNDLSLLPTVGIEIIEETMTHIFVSPVELAHNSDGVAARMRDDVHRVVGILCAGCDFTEVSESDIFKLYCDLSHACLTVTR